MAKVIVFGPTGNVGSVAARTAQELGAKVVLAMRDPQKTIPGLSAEDEKAGGYERVQADLSKADTVTEAVKKSGAKRAFIYLAFGTPDHMKATLSALKSGGIEFVVFLSSYTVHGNPKDIAPSEMIPFVHAQVELSLDEVFGPENYVAVRPGGFVTNLMRYKPGILAGEVRIFGSAFKLDCITPSDMGRVSGTILAEGKPRENGQRKVYLYGPQIISHRNAFGQIGEILGKDINVIEIEEDEGRAQMEKAGFPKPAVEYMMKGLKKVHAGEEDEDMSKRTNYDEGVKNVQLYTGRPSTGFKEWVQENRELFKA